MEQKVITILMADDDADDRLLTKEALQENFANHQLLFVEDGEELMDYLLKRGKYTQTEVSPLPNLILLDINMPRKDGFEAAKEIKSNPAFRAIPIVVLTTSRSERDVKNMYDLGVNSFITKPVTFDELVEAIKVMGQYWFETVKLPKS